MTLRSVAVALLLGVTACSGSSAPRDLTKPTEQELRAMASYLQAGAAVQQAAATVIGRLAPPPAGAEQWSVFRTAIAQFAAGTQAEATAARAGTVAPFLAAAQRLHALRSRVLESGLAVGLGAGTACARLF